MSESARLPEEVSPPRVHSNYTVLGIAELVSRCYFLSSYLVHYINYAEMNFSSHLTLPYLPQQQNVFSGLSISRAVHADH